MDGQSMPGIPQAALHDAKDGVPRLGKPSKHLAGPMWGGATSPLSFNLRRAPPLRCLPACILKKQPGTRAPSPPDFEALIRLKLRAVAASRLRLPWLRILLHVPKRRRNRLTPSPKSRNGAVFPTRFVEMSEKKRHQVILSYRCFARMGTLAGAISKQLFQTCMLVRSL